MKQGFIAVIIAVLFVSFQTGVSYAEGPAEKLGRGLANVATGWTEVFIETAVQREEAGHLTALFIGPIKGTFKAIGRTFSGLFDVLTCPISSTEPLVKPDFAWQRLK